MQMLCVTMTHTVTHTLSLPEQRSSYLRKLASKLMLVALTHSLTPRISNCGDGTSVCFHTKQILEVASCDRVAYMHMYGKGQKTRSPTLVADC